jgi:hypothetical protein
VAAIWSKIAATQIVAANEGSIAATLGLPLLRREKKKKTKTKQKFKRSLAATIKLSLFFILKKAKT